MVTNILMFIGGGSAGNGRRHKNHHLPGFGFCDVERSPWPRASHHRTPVHQFFHPTPGPHCRPAGCGSGHPRDVFAPHVHRLQPLDKVLFETISAFGTVGLSTGITYNLALHRRVGSDGPDLRGAHRYRHRFLSHRPGIPSKVVPATRRTAHHRLTFRSPQQVVGSRMRLKDEYPLLVFRQYPLVFTKHSGSGTTTNKPPIVGG